jgi:hypothetical protein
MAPSLATINGVPLLLIAVLVPLRFLQLSLRFFFSHRASSGYRRGTPTRSLLVLAFDSSDRVAEAVSKMRDEMEMEMEI